MYIGMRKLYKDKLARQLTGRLRRITADPLEVHLDQLEELTGQRYEDGNDRIDLAKNTQQPEVLSLLARDPNDIVRAYVARNPNTPPQALSELARDQDWQVKSSVARNPSTPPQVLSELARDRIWLVRASVARNLSTPPQVLSELARDPNDIVRSYVADNRNTPPQVLSELARDRNQRVRDAANRELERRNRSAAINIVDDIEDISSYGLPTEQEHPAGDGDDSHATRPSFSGPGGNLPRIEGTVDEDAEEPTHTSCIISIRPPIEVAEEIVNSVEGATEDPENLHVTVLYIGKVVDLDKDEILDAISPVLTDSDILEVRTQGIGVFDHDDDGRPFYLNVDSIGLSELRTDLIRALESAGIDLDRKYDFTPHMTMGYLDDLSTIDLDAGSPEAKWVSESVFLHFGDEVIELPLGEDIVRESMMVNNLDDLNSPSKGQGGTDNPADNHQSENTFEDPDLKLGNVEPPYSMGDGPMGTRFDDDKKYNIVKGADDEDIDKEAVGLIDNEIDENKYGTDYGRGDMAIPRAPAREKLLYR